MALVEINWKPTNRQLRQFGGIAVVALPLLAFLWQASLSVIGLMAGIGAAIGAVSFIFPKAVKPVFIAMSVAAIPIGIVVGEIVLLSVFLFVFLPMGLLFRLIGRDGLRLRKADGDTCWQKKRQPRNAASYFRQS